MVQLYLLMPDLVLACTGQVQTLVLTISLILQGIKKGWVDDPAVSGPTLPQVWDSLDTLNGDLFHWLQRLLELIPAGHSAKSECAGPYISYLAHHAITVIY